jgi:cold shock CspA family protein
MAYNSYKMSSSDTPVSKRFVGQVKWFNNKAGFGFVTMTDETGKQSDIFTHYSTVRVTDAQYKYLVQGEYVEFDLIESTNAKHDFQASNITGINGGNLMCETRQLNRPEKSSRQRREPPRNVARPPRDKPRDEPRDEPPRLVESDSEFKKVVTKRNVKKSRDGVTKGK